jgi:GNAT superfamily N-acetyltransferase
MTAPVVRERRPEDLVACVAGLAAGYQVDGYPLNWPADPAGWLTPAGLLHAWVAEVDGVVVGHVGVQAGDRPGEAVVTRLFVVPAARRRSAATALMTAALGWAADRGLRLRLEIADGPRAGAIAFYERAGWRFTHTTAAPFTDPDGGPVTLRHYEAPDPARRALP